jgi:hypothetical protein
MLHNDSRGPGGTVTVTIWGDPSGLRVEVSDAGGVLVPAVCRGCEDENGRGLCR